MKTLVPHFRLLAIFAFVFSTSSASASQKSLDELLQQDSRPTIAQVIDAVGLNPSSNPYENAAKANRKFVHVTYDLEGLAKNIAFMEFTFPGAIWAPLGRDAVIFGDAVDAFYTALGATGRVARLNASTESLHGQSRENIFRFLKEAGLDIEHSSRPFVGLDRTSFQINSQSRLLMRAAYESYMNLGVDPRTLPLRINFMGLGPGHVAKDAPSALEHIAELHDSTELTEILQLPVGHWTDSAPWNNSFGPLATQPNGKFEGTLGARFPNNATAILGEQIWILQHVTSSAFLAIVTEEARRLGYDFVRQVRADPRELMRASVERAAHEAQSLKSKTEEFIATLQTRQTVELVVIISRLGTIQSNGKSSTPERNSFASLRWWLTSLLEKVPPGETNLQTRPPSKEFELVKKIRRSGRLKDHFFTLPFFSEVTRAYDQQKLTSSDYRELIALALRLSELEPEFFEQLARVCETQPTLKKLLMKEEVFFGSSFNASRPDLEAAYAAIRSQALKSPVNAAAISKEVERMTLKRSEIRYREARQIIEEAFSKLPHLKGPVEFREKEENFASFPPAPGTSPWFYDIYHDYSNALKLLEGDRRLPELGPMLISKATNAFDQNLLTFEDYREIVALGLSNPSGVGRLDATCKELPTLMRLIIQEDLYFGTDLYPCNFDRWKGVTHNYINLREVLLRLPLNRSELIQRQISLFDQAEQWHFTQTNVDRLVDRLPRLTLNIPPGDHDLSNINLNKIFVWLHVRERDRRNFHQLLSQNELNAGHAIATNHADLDQVGLQILNTAFAARKLDAFSLERGLERLNIAKPPCEAIFDKKDL